MTEFARKKNQFRDRYMYRLVENIWRGKRIKRSDAGKTKRMTEANSVHPIPRHVGVALQVAMTSQLKRIRKCMLTTADRTCARAPQYLERLTDDVPRWARSGMLRWPACWTHHQQQQHVRTRMNVVLLSLSLPAATPRAPFPSHSHCTRCGIELGNLGSWNPINIFIC